MGKGDVTLREQCKEADFISLRRRPGVAFGLGKQLSTAEWISWRCKCLPELAPLAWGGGDYVAQPNLG